MIQQDNDRENYEQFFELQNNDYSMDFELIFAKVDHIQYKIAYTNRLFSVQNNVHIYRK